ncbi:MAG: L-serine ammonia-lyase, iron-sulfur-dependent, subunit beta [Tissierellia bacterium]|nr:L-serine ammonia-lyase, iron-sulfur-dependent, subunit beta [Tissierellia bacterium]
MKYSSVFDIIGPIMIGPSSSHTAGAVKIGRLARKIFNAKIEKADIHFYGSFAQTYQGHATDVAVVGGLLSFETDDVRIREAISYAKENGIEINFIGEKKVPDHPNTVLIDLYGEGKEMKILGVSVGGGAMEIRGINEFSVNITGDMNIILIKHKNVYGPIAAATEILAKNSININSMNVSKVEKGGLSLMTIEIDQKVPDDLIDNIKKADNIVDVSLIEV